MKEFAMRLKENADLKKSLEEAISANAIKAAVILSGVGCLKSCHIRLAGAREWLDKKEDLEIVSLQGTLAENGIHVHISVSDDRGNTFGGHLDTGCVVNTTCELVIAILEEYAFERQEDESTGYRELTVKKL